LFEFYQRETALFFMEKRRKRWEKEGLNYGKT